MTELSNFKKIHQIGVSFVVIATTVLFLTYVFSGRSLADLENRIFIGSIIFSITSIFFLYKNENKQTDITNRVLEAEEKAFRTLPEEIHEKTKELLASQETLEKRAQTISILIETSQKALQMGSLFDLYSKQIEKYQVETRSRASWSFSFAIISMFAGLGFVFWGGSQMILDKGWDHVVGGSAISVIGGGISAYITKTFLDVHKLSLNQLNQYFRQPVLNAHILTAQRIADQIPDIALRQTVYQAIANNVIKLIQDSDQVPYSLSGRESEKPQTQSTKPVGGSGEASQTKEIRGENA